MDTSNLEESTPLVFEPGTLTEAPDTRRRYQKRLAIYLILASTLFERMAFYTLVSNIVLTLQSPKFDWKPPNNVTALYIFTGTTYISTLIFAVISDGKLGRAKTIIIGFILYLIGYILITTLATETPFLCYSNKTNHQNGDSVLGQYCGPGILGTLICTAMGAGAVQSNMAVFGAEQTQKAKITSRYFDKYMIAVNVGSIIATLIISYIQSETKYYFPGYIIAASMLLVGALLFIIGLRYYIHVQPHDTVITKCIPVLINAFQTWWRNYKQKKSPVDTDNINASRMILLKASRTLAQQVSIRPDEPPSTFLGYANAANGGKFNDRIVNDVESLRGGIIVFTLLIPYWLIYNQINATFPLQGKQMSGSNGKNMIIWMSLGDPVTIIIGLFILILFVYKSLDARNREVIIFTKFVIGMWFALITMWTAGIVEMFRQEQCDLNHSMNQSSLSIYYQLPQYILMGFSELFATVASYKFAYFAAPRSAQSLFMSLRFCSLGISSFINTAYMYLFPTSNIGLDFRCSNHPEWQWNFYTYFFILAALQLIFIVILTLCQKKFQIIKINSEKLQEKQFI